MTRRRGSLGQVRVDFGGVLAEGFADRLSAGPVLPVGLAVST